MARHDRVAAFRILLATALEDARNATSTWARGSALGEAREARRALANLGLTA